MISRVVNVRMDSLARVGKVYFENERVLGTIVADKGIHHRPSAVEPFQFGTDVHDKAGRAVSD